MKTSPKTSSLNTADALSRLKEGGGRSLRWLVPLLLAASPLVQAQMLYTDPSAVRHVRHEASTAASRAEMVARMSFSEETAPLLFPLFPVGEVDKAGAAGKLWAPFYHGFLSAGSKEGRNAAASPDDAREIPEPSLGAVLLGGVALLVSFNLLRRRRLAF
ncbi:MAG TPA: hypothetical protein VNQ90_12880 [Chthoniobacteraceae bacterium]|nr:hypothetical protein [Chthoniobacteraceae bacterium]